MARSPSYPGIDLETALSRARTIYQHEKRNPAPTETVLKHWGYKPTTGPGRTTLAALKKFGLLVDQGRSEHRQVRLSDLALRILLDEREDSSERVEAIQSAALTPTIHAELWSKYGADLPSDATIAYYLKVERQFTESGAEELIDEFRRTLSFAGLDESGTVGRHGEGVETRGEGSIAASVDRMLGREGVPLIPAAIQRSLQFPLPGGGVATVQASRPLTDQEWMTFTTIVNMSKASFVDVDYAAEWTEDGPDEMADQG